MSIIGYKQLGCRLIPKLPPEIMQLILNYIKDPLTLRNCCKASRSLECLLQLRKPEYLWGEILNIIYGNGPDRLSALTLLRCRSVCKAWRTSVDSFVEKHPLRRPYDDNYFQQQLSNHISSTSILSDEFDSIRFGFKVSLSGIPAILSQFQVLNESSRSECPFVGRSVEIEMSIRNVNLPDVAAYAQHVFVFLQRFGIHIWHFTLKILRNDLLVFFMYWNFQKLLRHLPNLRSFNITTLVDMPLNVMEQYHRYFKSHFCEDKGTLLESLDDITILCPSSNIQIGAYLIMVPYTNQLRRISITRWPADFPIFLPNLQDFALTWISCNNDMEIIAEIRAPKLQKLELQFRYAKVSVRALHKCLLNFRGSLKHLEMDWSGKEFEAQGRSILLKCGIPSKTDFQLPELHTLKVSHALGLNYNFIRWFPNLRFLFMVERSAHDVRVPLYDLPQNRKLRKIYERIIANEGRSDGVEIHKYVMGGRKMFHSNIWKIFDKLQFVRYQRFRLPFPQGLGENDVFEQIWIK